MTGLLSQRQVILMVAFLLLSISMLLATVYYVFPISQEYEKSIETTKQKIRAKQADVRRLRMESEQLASSIGTFQALKKRGFFNAQDRVTAREMLDDIIRESDVASVEVSLPAAQVVNSNYASEANHKLLSGPMSFKVSAFSDKSIYRLMTALMRAFPGHLELKGIKLERTQKGWTSLRELENITSSSSPLVSGEMSFVWWTMASQKQMEANPYFNPALQPAPDSAAGGAQ